MVSCESPQLDVKRDETPNSTFEPTPLETQLSLNKVGIWCSKTLPFGPTKRKAMFLTSCRLPPSHQAFRHHRSLPDPLPVPAGIEELQSHRQGFPHISRGAEQMAPRSLPCDAIPSCPPRRILPELLRGQRHRSEAPLCTRRLRRCRCICNHEHDDFNSGCHRSKVLVPHLLHHPPHRCFCNSGPGLLPCQVGSPVHGQGYHRLPHRPYRPSSPDCNGSFEG